MLEKGKISAVQLAYVVFILITSLSVIFVPAQPAKHLAWLALLGALGEGLLFFYVCTTLAQKFPDKTLIGINDAVFGPLLGKLVSLAFLWYFIQIASYNLRAIADFFATLFPETPIVVFLLFLVLTSASAVRNGIEVIARCSVLIVPLLIFNYLFDDILLIKDMDFSSLLPLGDVPLTDFLKSVHAINSVQYGETVVLLMVYPFLSNIKKARVSVAAFIIAAALMAGSAARNTAVLGSLGPITTYTTFQTIRVINIGEFLTRLEILIAVAFIFMAFIKISVFYYASVLGLAQLLKLRTYLPLVLPSAVLITVFSIINFTSAIEAMHFTSETYPYYSLPFQIGLPLFTLVIAKVRGLPGKKKGLSP